MRLRVRRSKSERFSHGLTVLLLTAFMLRALIPTGWMPQASSSDGVTLVICTVAGFKQITLGPGGHPQPADESDQANAGNDPCSFASVVKLAPPALTALLVLPTDFAGIEPLSEAAAAPAATHLRLAESRAPPVSG
jgi:hypothetical protein